MPAGIPVISDNQTNVEFFESTETPDGSYSDLVFFLFRNWLTILTCVVLSCSFGAMRYAKSEPFFVSTTDLYIESAKVPEIGDLSMGEQLNRNMSLGATRGMIQSGLILERVLAKVKHKELVTFDGIGNPLNYLRDRLAEFTVPDDESPILRIAVKTKDAEESRLIASAIASEYTNFLDERNRGISNELRDLIVRAKEDLLSDLRRLDAEYDEFRASAPVVWKDGNAINIHHERQLELEKARKELLVKLSALEARAEKVTNAIRDGGRSYEAIVFEAMKELGPEYTEPEASVSAPIKKLAVSGPETLVKRLYDEYADLLFKERQLKETYGKGHPDILAIRNRRAKLKVLIESQTAQLDKANAMANAKPDEAKEMIDYPLIYEKFLAGQMTELDDQLTRLNEAFKGEEDSANRIETFVQKDQALRREMSRTQSLFDALVARLDEISIIQNYKGDRATVVETALPGKRVNVSLAQIGILSFILGSLLGIAIAFGREMLDDSFSDPDEIRTRIGVPILAHIPGLKAKPTLKSGSRLHESICAHHSPKSRAAESFRGIRNKLFFSSLRGGARVIQVTSPLPGDGKSTVISNLAVTIAASGKSVVIVDADCRRPRIDRIFGVERKSKGLVEVIRQEAQLKDALIRTEVSGMFLLPSGKIPDNPAELLISNRFGEVLEALKKKFDFVLVDSPPMLAVSDGSGIATKTDGVVLVLRLNKRSKATSLRTMQVLNEIDASVIGLVVNDVKPNQAKNGYKGYGYGGRGYGSYGGYGGYGGFGYGYDAYGQEMSEYYADKKVEKKAHMQSS